MERSEECTRVQKRAVCVCTWGPMWAAGLSLRQANEAGDLKSLFLVFTPTIQAFPHAFNQRPLWPSGNTWQYLRTHICKQKLGAGRVLTSHDGSKGCCYKFKNSQDNPTSPSPTTENHLAQNVKVLTCGSCSRIEVRRKCVLLWVREQIKVKREGELASEARATGSSEEIGNWPRESNVSVHLGWELAKKGHPSLSRANSNQREKTLQCNLFYLIIAHFTRSPCSWWSSTNPTNCV